MIGTQKQDRLSLRSMNTWTDHLPSLPVPLYLSFKEIWRNKGRFAAICSVVTLITTLVLFIAGLTEGLGNGNREYLQNLDAQLIVFQENVDVLVTASRLPRSLSRRVIRLAGVADAGAISFSNVSVAAPDDLSSVVKVALIGVEPQRPGEPPVYEGQGLSRNRAEEAVIDANVARQTGLGVGDTIAVKSTIGTDEKFYDLEVVGITESQQYFIQPSITVPFLTWQNIRPRSATLDDEVTFNIVAVKLENPEQMLAMQPAIQGALSGIEVVDVKTAYEASPGYTAQQSTLNTQRYFTLLIGLLVIGGFFQIQTLQKVSQVGMLKAIGASTWVIIITAIMQIVTINCLGVILGAIGTLGLGFLLPPGIPIIFEGSSVSSAIISLLIIGPLGGMASLRVLLKTEPLTALGLSS